MRRSGTLENRSPVAVRLIVAGVLLVAARAEAGVPLDPSEDEASLFRALSAFIAVGPSGTLRFGEGAARVRPGLRVAFGRSLPVNIDLTAPLTQDGVVAAEIGLFPVAWRPGRPLAWGGGLGHSPGLTFGTLDGEGPTLGVAWQWLSAWGVGVHASYARYFPDTRGLRAPERNLFALSVTWLPATCVWQNARQHPPPAP